MWPASLFPIDIAVCLPLILKSNYCTCRYSQAVPLSLMYSTCESSMHTHCWFLTSFWLKQSVLITWVNHLCFCFCCRGPWLMWPRLLRSSWLCERVQRHPHVGGAIVCAGQKRLRHALQGPPDESRGANGTTDGNVREREKRSCPWGLEMWEVTNIAIVFLISILRERVKNSQKIEMINWNDKSKS